MQFAIYISKSGNQKAGFLRGIKIVLNMTLHFKQSISPQAWMDEQNVHLIY